jgi:protein-tyrosine phosphatase
VKYVLAFGFLSAYLLTLAAFAGGAAWVLAWPALSFALVAAAYAGLGARIFGKRPTGRLAPWAVLLLWPYLLLTWAVWHAGRLFDRRACASEVAPGLWLGRRALARELPPGVGLVVDLTAEFPEPRGVVANRIYVCVPVLDSTAPAGPALRELVQRVAGWQGGVFVHCAKGHGRSALVAAGVLLARGLAADAGEAERLLRAARPGVRLNAPQRRLLEGLAKATGP